jgi:hypothetical protein
VLYFVEGIEGIEEIEERIVDFPLELYELYFVVGLGDFVHELYE